MKRGAVLGTLAICFALAVIESMPTGGFKSSAAASFATLQQTPRPLRLIPGLQSITFWERTGSVPISNTFSVDSPQLETRVSTLHVNSRDFRGAPSELYDVFYSDANGAANRDGAYVTVEAIWDLTLPSGGGLNIAEVELNFPDAGSRVFGNEVSSFLGLGDNYLPASVANAADGNLQTHSTMGNTVGQSERLRITIGFPTSPCTFSISTSGLNFPATGSDSDRTGTATVTTPRTCSWTAATSYNWITLTPRQGEGNGTVSYSLATNTGAPRIGRFRINTQTFTVIQEGQCSVSISPERVTTDEHGGVEFIAVTAPSNCTWVAEVTSGNFLSIGEIVDFGNGTWRVIYGVSQNDSFQARTGTIHVGGRTHTIIQRDMDCPLEFNVACARGCGDNDNTLTLSRRFRDQTLARTPNGQRYTDLYYQFSSEAVQIVMLNPMLVLRSREILERYKPVIESMVKGEPVTLTHGDVQEIDGFLNAFAAKGSAELRETLKGLSEDLRDPQVHSEFNITVTDGPKRDLPAGHKLLSLKQAGWMMLPVGLFMIFAYGAKPTRRRTATSGRKRLPLVMVGALIIAVASQFCIPRPGLGITVCGAGSPPVDTTALAYSTYLGGGGDDQSMAMAVDAAGNTYIAGFTNSSDFPLVAASQPAFGGGQQDAFVTKLDPRGRVIYSTYLGGNGQDNATGIAADAAGNAYITGYTESTNFPVRNALQATKSGSVNAFLVKLDPAGSVLTSTLLGGSVSDYGGSVAVDAAGNIYVAGITTSPTYPTVNAVQTALGGLVDAYVTKLNPSAERIIYSTFFGGNDLDGATSIAVDAAGNAYLTGLTASKDLRTTSHLQAAHGGGLFDAFVAKLNPSGAQVVYATYLGGGGEDRPIRIAVDAGGNACLTGDTDSVNFPVANALQPVLGGGADAFVAKLNPSGTALIYSTYLGGRGHDGGAGLVVDPGGGAYVAGFTASTNFQLATPLQPAFGGGAMDGFAAKLNAAGTALEYSTFIGGGAIDLGFGIAADPGGNAYVMGLTSSTDFPTANALQPAFGGGVADVFVAKIKPALAITRAEIQGKHLLVFGCGFDPGAKILLNGEEQKTRNDDVNPTGALFGKKVGKKIAPDQTVTLQVRNSDGTLSNPFSFARPG